MALWKNSRKFLEAKGMKSIPVVSLSDIAESIQYGHTASAENAKVGPKFLRITDIVPAQIDWDTVPHCTIDEKKFKKFSLESGDIVIARTGATVGYAKLIRNSEPSIFASYLVRIRINPDKADAGYIGRIVESDIYKRFVLSQVGGAAQPNANAKILSSFKVPLPEKSAQSRIASILSAYDDLIENNRRRIQLLEQAARLLYKEWFVHFRFPGHEHTTITDGVPEGWIKRTIGERFQTVLGGTPSRKKSEYWGGDIPWINSGEVNKLRILTATEFITGGGLVKSAAKLMPIGTAILAITGATLGQVSRLEIECSANQSVIGICDVDDLWNEWIYLFFVDEIKKIINHATGGAQQHINKEIVDATEYLEPPDGLLNVFREEIKPIFSQIKNLELQNISLSQSRALFLPKLMSGEISA